MIVHDTYQDLPSNFYCLEKAAYNLLNIKKPQDSIVWEIVKCSETIPHFGNAYALAFFTELEKRLLDIDPSLKIDYWINALDTNFSVNGEKIEDDKDLKEVLLSKKRKSLG